MGFAFPLPLKIKKIPLCLNPRGYIVRLDADEVSTDKQPYPIDPKEVTGWEFHRWNPYALPFPVCSLAGGVPQSYYYRGRDKSASHITLQGVLHKD